METFVPGASAGSWFGPRVGAAAGRPPNETVGNIFFAARPELRNEDICCPMFVRFAAIGAIFGIQALSAILGGSTSASAFALAYGVGAVVAVTSIYGSGRVHSTLGRPALRVTSAAA